VVVAEDFEVDGEEIREGGTTLNERVKRLKLQVTLVRRS